MHATRGYGFEHGETRHDYDVMDALNDRSSSSIHRVATGFWSPARLRAQLQWVCVHACAVRVGCDARARTWHGMCALHACVHATLMWATTRMRPGGAHVGACACVCGVICNPGCDTQGCQPCVPGVSWCGGGACGTGVHRYLDDLTCPRRPGRECPSQEARRAMLRRTGQFFRASARSNLRRSCCRYRFEFSRCHTA